MSGWEIWIEATKDNKFPGANEDRPLLPRETYRLKREAQREADTMNQVPWKAPQWTYVVRKVGKDGTPSSTS